MADDSQEDEHLEETPPPKQDDKQHDPSPSPSPSAAPVDPPAARTVLQGKAKEGQKDLQAEYEKKLKDRELRVMQLEDENRTLKQARENHKPTPKPARKSPWTFFDEE